MCRHGENIYRRKDGRYEGRYVIGKTAEGKTRFGYVYGYQYMEVRNRLAEHKAVLVRPLTEPPARCRITLREWMMHWMENEMLGSVKASSYQTYLTQINKHILPELGGLYLTQLTPALAYEFTENLRAAGLSTGTVKGVFRLLSAALRFALDEGVIRKNPCRKLKIRQGEQMEQRVLSRSEQEKVRLAADERGDLPVLLSLYTGMRLGEVSALKWTDIDWEKKTITVRRTAQRMAQGRNEHGRRTLLMLGSPKSRRSHRVLPVPDFLLAKLNNLLAAGTAGEFVFSASAHAAEPRTLQRRFSRLMEAVGLTDVHFHTLRHSFATRLLELGVDIQTVSALLGQWEDMTVEQMSKFRPVIPFTGYRYHRGCANPAWLRVLIMTQADGYYTADGSVRYHFKKQRKVERCKTLLRRAEIPFMVNEYKHEIISITVPARAVPLWLRQFRTKTFGFWLLDENPDLFFDELPNWDGYYPAPNSIQYSTVNRQNADIVQALAHMSGRCCSMKIKHRPDKPQWQDTYVLTIWLTPGNRHELRTKPIISNYLGKVYCAVTSTGYFLVRRNGRVWVTGNSGRLIQLQNLPQSHLMDLNEARALVATGDYEALEMLYDDVPDTLSQLIRTAFIPKPGNRFFVADFSAIEARVIAWLAGEQWRLDAFERGEDIYCASASQMFHVPVEKNGINGQLRQKGKVAELACIAEDSLVLTDKGLVPIQCVKRDMLLWDGFEWVRHEGVVFKGKKEVIEYEGLRATPDHLVWVEGKTEPVRFVYAATCGAHLVQAGNGDGLLYRGESSLGPSIAWVYDILNAGPRHRYTVSGKLVHNCGYGGSVGALKAMGALEMGLQEHELSGLIQQWRSANPNIVRLWWDVDRVVKTCVSERTHSETHGI